MTELAWINESHIYDGTLTIYDPYFSKKLAALPALEKGRPDIHTVEFQVKDGDELKGELPKLERLGIKLQGLPAQFAQKAIELFGPSLVHLGLRDGWASTGSDHVTGEHLKALSQFSSLREIDLNGCSSIADLDLKPLAAHKGLEQATLHRLPLRGRGLQGLAPGLVDLSMSGAEENRRVQAFDIEPLERFSSLRKLAVGNVTIADDALRSLSKLGALEALSLSASLNDESLAFLEEMEQLQGFSLSKMNKPQSLKVKVAPAFKGLRSLRRLDLGRLKIKEPFFESFAELEGLEHLRAVGGSASDEAVATLEGRPALQILVLSGKKLTDAVFGSLAKLPELRCLHLHRASITAEGLATLKGLKLRELAFSFVKEGDALVPALKDLDHLERLMVGKCGLSKKGIAELSEHFGDRFTPTDSTNPNTCLIWSREKGWYLWPE